MTRTARAELRADLLARVPRGYSPALHLALVTLGALGVAAGALALTGGLEAWELALVPVYLVAGNAVEWHLHRGLLHRRTRPVQVLYVRHTPQHHALFVADDLAFRSWRELRFVLLPAYGLFVLLAATAPVPIALALLGQRDAALLFVASAAGYVLVYEWVHLVHHLPPEGRVGRLGLVRAMREHHRLHHAPHLMNRWNFNVTVPLWDWVRGTWYRRPSVVAPAAAAHRR